MPLAGTTVAHYRILERLGGGGMGVVFKAWDPRLERYAALKFLSPHRSNSEDFKRRFTREARTASRLEHPNICTVFETDQTEDGRLFIAMAFCDGESLKRKIEHGPLPVAQALAIGAQIAAGLAAAHDKGVVHRDIKPGNVMVADDGRVRIVDFGIARLADQTRLTRTGEVMGTTAYVAPELFLSEEADHRVDLWALGVVLYEMVTGRLPWSSNDERDMVNAIVKRPPRPIPSLRQGVPQALERIVLRALAKRPGERYQRAIELHADLLSVAERVAQPALSESFDQTLVEAPPSGDWPSTPARSGSLTPGAPSLPPPSPVPEGMPPGTAERSGGIPAGMPSGTGGASSAGGATPGTGTGAFPVAAGRLVGRIVSHYRILGHIGGGGMGVVYKAQDLLLGRVVALKFLPPEMTRDEDSKTRFLQEARAASALDHPNICTIHEVGETEEGQLFLAMACYEGETLKQRLVRGRLAIDDAVELAQQVARGLVKAHRNGIVHRDIKPANLMITSDEIVKILDFGIAKLAGAAGLTRTGSSLGTPGYMSPEQARGEEVDPRTDVWSLGAVLYEMVTGRRPFRGEHEQTILYALFNEEPEPLLKQRPDAPPELARVVGQMLAKNPEQRYPSAAAALTDLRALYGPVTGTLTGSSMTLAALAQQQPAAPRRGKVLRRGLAAGALALACLGGAWYVRQSRESVPIDPRRVHDARLTEFEGKETFPSLAPDGHYFVYAKKVNGRSALFSQRVGGDKPVNLSQGSPADDTQPAYSPDGQQIAFRSERNGGGIYLMGSTGESVRRLNDSGFNPTWSPDGSEIAYASEGIENPLRRVSVSKLWRINVNTGQKRLIFDGDGVQPAWSPDGKRIAFWSSIPATGHRIIWTIAADGGQPRQVTADDGYVNWSPAWAPDGKYLYFSSNRSGLLNLWRVRIDQDSGEVLGAAEPLTTPTGTGLMSFASDNHRMVYASDDSQQNLEAIRLDPQTGEALAANPEWTTHVRREVAHCSASPDGQWIAYATAAPQEDLFVIHPDGSGLRQLTNDHFKNRSPEWSADGSQLVFYSNRSGNYQAWSIDADGSEPRQLTAFSQHVVSDPQLAPDGKRLACNLDAGNAALVDLTVPLAARQPQFLPPVPGAGFFGVTSWSRDGLRLAGRDRLHCLVVYDLQRKTYRPTAQSGLFPRWLVDSRRLIYLTNADMANGSNVEILDTATGVSHEVRKAPQGSTFRTPIISPDGRQLYVIQTSEEGDIWLRTIE